MTGWRFQGAGNFKHMIGATKMLMKAMKTRLAIVLILASLLISACSGGFGPKPTEKEIVIDPNEGRTEEVSAPISTPTLRPTPTFTPEPTAGQTQAPTPTNTLNPYDTLIFEGTQLRVEEQFDSAIAKFAEAIQTDPTNPQAYIERGITNSSSGKPDEAIADFNFAINYDPASAQAYNARGVAWAQKEQLEQAIKDYVKAIELQPDFAKAYSNRAIAYMLQSKFEDGLADFSKVIEITPDNPEAYFNRGQAYITAMNQQLNDSYIELCIADFTQVLAFQPEDPESLFSRGLCQSFKTNFVRSMEDYTAAIALDAEQARYYLYRALLYPDIGSQEQAMADAQKVLDLSQDPEMRQVAEQLLRELPLTPTPTPGATPTPLD
jgi:tetratricopeptide (TPR) repeat protein